MLPSKRESHKADGALTLNVAKRRKKSQNGRSENKYYYIPVCMNKEELYKLMPSSANVCGDNFSCLFFLL